MTPRRVLVGVGGGIAAYKVCELVRRFAEAGDDVTVIPTTAALNFVGATTWAALSGKPIATSQFEEPHKVAHVELARELDLVVLAPATADLIARLATGQADDLLTATLLMLKPDIPVVVCPAMHTEMWQHRATQANVETLRARGVEVMPPAVGRLTGPDSGPGRLPEASEIFDHANRYTQAKVLNGRTIVVTAGGTREPLDPVRFLGNASSGKQGYAIAAAAAQLGAKVELISANSSLTAPTGVRVTEVTTTAQLQAATTEAASRADAVIMAAAPADYRPAQQHATKIKRDAHNEFTLQLVENPDILAGLAADRGDSQHPLLIGFAAETGDETGSVLELAQAKLARKGCDGLVVNDVVGGAVFGAEHNSAVLLRPDQPALDLGSGTKRQIADRLLEQIVNMLGLALTQ